MSNEDSYKDKMRIKSNACCKEGRIREIKKNLKHYGRMYNCKQYAEKTYAELIIEEQEELDFLTK